MNIPKSVILYIILTGFIVVPQALYLAFLLICRLWMKKTYSQKAITPTISMIICAHNEEKNIGQKINNTLSLDYPRDKLQIIIASDASDDKTEDIAASYKNQGVILVNNKERQGKTASQNKALKIATGEIILFSDATTIYAKDSLKKIVRNFADRRVGAVGGNLCYSLDKLRPVNIFSKVYWDFEKFIKTLESSLGLLFGLSGCMYAVRRSLVQPLEIDLMEDLARPLQVLTCSYINIFEKEAICYERVNTSVEEELDMRTRVTTRTMHTLCRLKNIISPRKYPKIFISLLIHKILRYLTPFCMLSCTVIAVFSPNILISQIIILFFLLSGISFLLSAYRRKNKTIKSKPILFLHYLFLSNLAVILAFLNILGGNNKTTWESLR